jgi:hypothetical protein
VGNQWVNAVNFLGKGSGGQDDLAAVASDDVGLRTHRPMVRILPRFGFVGEVEFR